MEIILFETNKIIMSDKVFLSKTLIESLIKLQQLYAMGRFAVPEFHDTTCASSSGCASSKGCANSGSMRLMLRKV